MPNNSCTPFLMCFKNSTDINKDGNIDAKDAKLVAANISKFVQELNTTISTVATHLEMDAAKAKLFMDKMLMNVDKLIVLLNTLKPFLAATDPQGAALVETAVTFLTLMRPVDAAAISIVSSAVNITPPTDFDSFGKTIDSAQITSSTIEANLKMLKLAGVPGMDAAVNGFVSVDAALNKAQEIYQALATAKKQNAMFEAFNAAAAASVATTAPSAPTLT